MKKNASDIRTWHHSFFNTFTDKQMVLRKKLFRLRGIGGRCSLFFFFNNFDNEKHDQ